MVRGLFTVSTRRPCRGPRGQEPRFVLHWAPFRFNLAPLGINDIYVIARARLGIQRSGIIMRGSSSGLGGGSHVDHGKPECRRGLLALSRSTGGAEVTNRVWPADGRNGNDSMKLQERRRSSSARGEREGSVASALQPAISDTNVS